MAEVISVSALNRYVKNLLDVNDVLFDLALRGEIANFVQNARSGQTCKLRGTEHRVTCTVNTVEELDESTQKL